MGLGTNKFYLSRAQGCRDTLLRALKAVLPMDKDLFTGQRFEVGQKSA